MDAYEITVEVYKRDRRVKSGERLVLKKDHMVNEPTMLKHTYRTTYLTRDGYRVEFYDTWVERKNLLTGERFVERYDTPRSCSPASETYWSA